MTTKIKVFLSHSSADQSFVGRVYKELGAGICHYYSATFDRAGSIAEEIHEALATSTHFVLFASPVAMASPWVNGEMQRAFERWMGGGVQQAMATLPPTSRAAVATSQNRRKDPARLTDEFRNEANDRSRMTLTSH